MRYLHKVVNLSRNKGLQSCLSSPILSAAADQSGLCENTFQVPLSCCVCITVFFAPTTLFTAILSYYQSRLRALWLL